MNTTPYGPPLIGALLRMSLETVRERMLERLHERGFDDLAPAHLIVLQYPGPQGLRPSDLAARLRMSKQALNYLLGQLERLSYLRRQDDPRDQRFKRIALTERGQRAARAMRDIVREIETEWEQRLGPERFAQLRLLLTDLNDHLAADRTRADQDPATPPT
jgi:DNA-binding MarR family transcriptional regulator